MTLISALLMFYVFDRRMGPDRNAEITNKNVLREKHLQPRIMMSFGSKTHCPAKASLFSHFKQSLKPKKTPLHPSKVE